VTPDVTPALAMAGASVWVPEGAALLQPVDWTVAPGEHWLVLGGNGAGKSTLLSLAAAARRPSAGTVTVTGQRLGRVDLRDLRALLGRVDGRLAERFPPRATGRDVVMTGATGTTERLTTREHPRDAARTEEVMALLHCERLAGRLFTTCSTGERQRLLIARALVPRPRLLLLDEPTTGLDFVARETLLRGLQALAAAEPDLATVLVTHHLEDVPPSTTHALLLREGRALRQGPVRDVLTAEAVSDCYGTAVEVDTWHGRWRAVAVGPVRGAYGEAGPGRSPAWTST
jgi:iron complex transport system ATP-binding protein